MKQQNTIGSMMLDVLFLPILQCCNTCKYQNVGLVIVTKGLYHCDNVGESKEDGGQNPYTYKTVPNKIMRIIIINKYQFKCNFK